MRPAMMLTLGLLALTPAACSERPRAAVRAATCAVHDEPLVFGRGEPPEYGYLCTPVDWEREFGPWEWQVAYGEAAAAFPNAYEFRKLARDGQAIIRRCDSCAAAEAQWLREHPRDG